MTLRSRPPWGVLFLCLWGTAVTLTSAQANGAVSAKDIRVTLLGTASGPRAFVDKAGISTLVEAGGERLLFDAGRGFMQRLVQAGFPMNAVTKLFLTHLHSDHIIGVPARLPTTAATPTAPSCRSTRSAVHPPTLPRVQLPSLQGAHCGWRHRCRRADFEATTDTAAYLTSSIAQWYR